jgi:O-antigen ligase
MAAGVSRSSAALAGSGARRPDLLPLAAGLLAAGLGALYAVASYRIDPSLLPVIGAGTAAVVLGLWRLEWGIALVIVVTPFAENAPISDPGSAKIRVALIVWAVTLVLVQTGRTLVNRDELRAPPMFLSVAAFLTAALIAVPIADDAGAATSKFLLLGGAAVIYLLIGLFLREWAQLKPVLGAFVVAGFVVSIHAIYQYLSGDLSRVGFVSESGAVEYRVASFFAHPNQLAGFLALMVPLGAGLARVFDSRLAKAACLALVPLAVVGVAVTYSRAALVALLALPLIYIRDRRVWPIVALAALTIVLLSPAAWTARVAGATQTDQPEIASRLDIWDSALQIFTDRPVTGVGLENFAGAYVGTERAARSFLGNGGLTPPETAHNLYLNTLAEQGLIGAAALLLLAFAFARLALRLRRSPDLRVRAFGGAALGVGIVLLFENLFDLTFNDPKTATLVWGVFGVTAALSRLDSEARNAADPAS